MLGGIFYKEVHRFRLRFGTILFITLCTDVALLCVLLPFVVPREEETVGEMKKLLAVCVVIQLLSKFYHFVGCCC